MPLYDFACRGCGHEFEALVRPGRVPPCPRCGAPDPERKLSPFAVGGGAGASGGGCSGCTAKSCAGCR
ncbi:FmdB family zinc ribbon protein [Deferrisoma camini]|uniref:FmdB family zinc ribbon protein n=1 Tax=Deferrisoma camini TaxID=1035120 RepID=UPI00046CD908|nr:zinc ribbon domain-containing protein [Deferrisoma camini]